jgi:hypothetical protein
VLLQHPNDLLFREPRSLHLSVLVSRPDSKSPWRKISVAGQRRLNIFGSDLPRSWRRIQGHDENISAH